MLRTLAVAASLLLTSGCAFHSTATDWNQRIGPDGDPVFYTTTTKVGANLVVAIPFLGKMGIDGLVHDMTEKIAERGGDHVRIVQGGSENYWYGFPPVTWVLTPVVATIAAEYHPSEGELIEAMFDLERDEDHRATDEEIQARADARAKAWLDRRQDGPSQ